MTLAELKEKKASLGADRNKIAEEIAEKILTASVEDIDALKARRDELQKKYDILCEEEKVLEAAGVAQAKPVTVHVAKSMEEVRGEFYRDAFAGRIKKAYEGLGSIPTNTADLGYGEKLLPENMSRSLISELAYEGNSLRQYATVTNVTNLVVPKIRFTYDGSLDDVQDFEAAREVKAEGDRVSFGRFETRIKVPVADSVLFATPLDLQVAIERGLREGIATKEGAQSFATSSDGVHDHMSFYLNNNKQGAGSNMRNAIIKALGDLPSRYATPVVYMRKSDYFGMLDQLNGQADYYGKKPEEVIGVPVVFHDYAIQPVIGDFSYYWMNYERVRYETDRNIDKGMSLFVMSANVDQRIILKSAFRLAYVYAQILGATAALESGDTGAPGDDIEVTGVTMNDGSTPAAGLTYQWQKFTGGSWTDLTSSYTGYHGAKLTTKSTDGNASFRCVVTYNDSTNPASSAASNVITMLAGA